MIQERLLRSGAVRKELLELVTDFNTKFKAGAYTYYIFICAPTVSFLADGNNTAERMMLQKTPTNGSFGIKVPVSWLTSGAPFLFVSALKAPAKEADNAEGDAEGEAEGSDGDSEGPSDSPDSVVEEEEEARGPVEDGEAAGAGSLHLLSKLMAMRQTGRDRAPTQAKVAQG